jgi:AraC-like DNA-binding protein
MQTARTVWSTDAVEPGKRLPAWRDFMARTFDAFEMDYRCGGDFWAQISAVSYGPITIGRINGSPRHGGGRRWDGHDSFVFGVPFAGEISYRQDRREVTASAGEGAFYHNCLPGEFRVNEGTDYWYVSVPASSLPEEVGGTSRLIGHKIASNKPEMRLLIAYLQSITGTPGLTEGDTRGLIGRQVAELIGAAVGKAANEDAPERGVRAARYRLALDEISRRFADPMLNGARVARIIEVSERYLQKLFEEHGNTVSTHIMETRLNAARAKLANPLEDKSTVAEIAYSVGFSDTSHFSRAYRRAFGETPASSRGCN